MAASERLPVVRQRTPNVARFLQESARQWPERPALVWDDGELDWRELDARVDALAAGLAARGVRRGDAVMVVTPNCPQLVETMFAVFRMGAIVVPVNFRLTPRDLAVIAETCQPAAVVAEARFAEHVAAVTPRLQGAGLVVSIGQAPFADVTVDALIDEHLGHPAPQVDTFRGDPAWFFFTSGSSGRPKAAVLTHDQLAFVAANYLLDLLPDSSERDVCLVIAPLSHGAGTHMITQVAAAATSVLASGEGFSAREAWRLVERHGVTNTFVVPTILKLMVEDPAVDEFDRSSLRQVIYAGAPIYRHDQDRAREKLGDVLVQFYGMAEVTSCITTLPARLHDHPSPDEVPFNTCGVTRTGMQISVQDDQGQEQPAGVTGEVCVCGPGVFAGYLDNDEANAHAFRNGWFRTGDLGFLDAEGYLYLTGRASDMYISGGSNIDPRELEEKILEHPALDEVAVVGVPDPVWGEVGVAVCVARSGQSVGDEELLSWMKERIARYKVPKQVLLWDALPRSDYGKVTKKLVRDAMRERGELA
jgi:fatty-acyl-CoA synthase